jgi:hypothetical protein
MTRWYVTGLIASLAIGWIASNIHLSGHAPFGVVSLVVGLSLGAALVATARRERIADVRRLVVGTLLFALLTAATEHALVYRDFRRQWRDAREKEPAIAAARPLEPWSPVEYLRREATPGRLVFWGVDFVLIAGAAVGVVMAGRERGA